MSNAQPSFPQFRILNPALPEVPVQYAWTEGQAARKKDRLEKEKGKGFVIEPNTPAAHAAAEPAAESAAVAAAGEEADAGAVYSDPSETRSEQTPFVRGDIIRCQISGTEAQVLQAFSDHARIQTADGRKHRLPAANYADYELLKEGEPAPAPAEPPPPDAAPEPTGSSPAEPAEAPAAEPAAEGATAAEGESARPPSPEGSGAVSESAPDSLKKKVMPKRPTLKKKTPAPAKPRRK